MISVKKQNALAKIQGSDICMLACSFWLRDSLCQVMWAVEDFPQHTGLPQWQTAFICSYSGIKSVDEHKQSQTRCTKPPGECVSTRITLLISFRHFTLEVSLTVTNFSKSHTHNFSHTDNENDIRDCSYKAKTSFRGRAFISPMGLLRCQLSFVNGDYYCRIITSL